MSRFVTQHLKIGGRGAARQAGAGTCYVQRNTNYKTPPLFKQGLRLLVDKTVEIWGKQNKFKSREAARQQTL